MNVRKPRPANSGEPQTLALGALMLGQRRNNPVVGRRWQSPLPPIQFNMPECPIKEAPIKKTTVPVGPSARSRGPARSLGQNLDETDLSRWAGRSS